MSSLLYGIGPTDPLTYGLVILGLTLTAAVAAYLPARRAPRTDPALLLSSAWVPTLWRDLADGWRQLAVIQRSSAPVAATHSLAAEVSPAPVNRPREVVEA